MPISLSTKEFPPRRLHAEAIGPTGVPNPATTWCPSAIRWVVEHKRETGIVNLKTTTIISQLSITKLRDSQFAPDAAEHWCVLMGALCYKKPEL